MVTSLEAYADLFPIVVDKFNQYSEENRLGITVKMTSFTEKNTTMGTDDSSSAVDLLLKKKIR